MKTIADAVILGGGVVGLSIAYELSGRGVGCAVLDRGSMGRAASWAGAGMIAPGSEKFGSTSEPMVWIRSQSALLYEQWSKSLHEEVGIDNGYRRLGGVDAALTPEEDLGLQAMAGRWRTEGVVFERLAPGDYHRVEPALTSDLVSAYFLPDRAQVRNPWHLRALTTACAKRGVILLPDHPALGFVRDGARITAVRTPAGDIAAGMFVVAAGPWSEELLSDLRLTVPTPPVKGEIVLLQGPPGLLKRIVEHGNRYLVPRDEGRILVGSTEELVGFDTRVTSAAVTELRAFAARICPALADLPMETSWAGLRPGSLDTRPYLGSAPGLDNLLVATGHKRAGLQLAPATAVILADLVQGLTPPIDLTSFRPGRTAADSQATGDSSIRS